MNVITGTRNSCFCKILKRTTAAAIVTHCSELARPKTHRISCDTAFEIDFEADLNSVTASTARAAKIMPTAAAQAKLSRCAADKPLHKHSEPKPANKITPIALHEPASVDSFGCIMMPPP